MVLAESGEAVSQLGSVADYVEVDERYELAVAACLGDLLQHVVVQSHEHATAGLAFARERNAGRVGFLIATTGGGRRSSGNPTRSSTPRAPGVLPLSAVVRVSGPAAERSSGSARTLSWPRPVRRRSRRRCGRRRPSPRSTARSFAGAHRVEGGVRSETRTILATKREIKQLREHAELETAALARLRGDAAASTWISPPSSRRSRRSSPSSIDRKRRSSRSSFRSSAPASPAERVSRKQEQVAVERRTAEEELSAQEARQDEARESIHRIELEQRTADEQLSTAQRRLFEAREAAESQARRTAEAKAAHAALVERTSGLVTEIQRLEEASNELEQRAIARAEDLRRNGVRREELRASIEHSERQLTNDLHALRRAARGRTGGRRDVAVAARRLRITGADHPRGTPIGRGHSS